MTKDEAIRAVQRLIDMASGLNDCGCDDGDGYYDEWQSDELMYTLKKAQMGLEAIKEEAE
jgi:hypothetical protein